MDETEQLQPNELIRFFSQNSQEFDDYRDADRHKDLAKEKLTLTESIVGVILGIAVVSIIAVSLVLEIHYIVVDRHISDAFLGLILVPLVEKIAGKSPHLLLP